MEYKENDILFDSKYKEVFVYQEAVDKFMVTQNPERVRLATEEEVQKLKASGKDAITV